ncbi:hypothetical protein RIF29_25320 [Crotalaria pallida]|uniref:Uncharacterized protein n=1 Tax=Crotalaria pallida TaxID=3830 RepID=A0AAN9ELX8_CROPI
MADIYFPAKRLGKHFAFVCFNKVMDAMALEKRMDNLWFGNKKVWANISKFEKSFPVTTILNVRGWGKKFEGKGPDKPKATVKNVASSNNLWANTEETDDSYVEDSFFGIGVHGFNDNNVVVYDVDEMLLQKNMEQILSQDEVQNLGNYHVEKVGKKLDLNLTFREENVVAVSESDARVASSRSTPSFCCGPTYVFLKPGYGIPLKSPKKIMSEAFNENLHVDA